ERAIVMSKHSRKKLALRLETLRTLAAPELDAALGGAGEAGCIGPSGCIPGRCPDGQSNQGLTGTVIGVAAGKCITGGDMSRRLFHCPNGPGGSGVICTAV